MILVYDQTGQAGQLSDLLSRIDGRVFMRSAAYYKGPEKGASAVYTASDEIAAEYATRGVDVYDLGGDPYVDGIEPDAVKTDGDGLIIVPKGGGHYDIMVNGEHVDTVQGRDAAQERATELTNS